VSDYGFDRARRQEMRRIRKSRATVSKSERVARRDYPLWVKALARVLIFTLIWAAGAIALHILAPAGNTMDFPAPAAQGRTTDVTSSLPPHPATSSGHP
jgi:hypothetical protein